MTAENQPPIIIKEPVEENAMEEQRIALVVERATVHAKANIVKANDQETKCVDGGYRVGEAEGALAFAGADLGTAMALLAVENPKTAKPFEPREAFEAVMKYCQFKGRKFFWHTDTHAGHGEHAPVVGCGHCNAAITKLSEAYGVAAEKVEALLTIVREAQVNEQYKDQMECIILHRDHAEQAILVVNDLNYSIRPWDNENSEGKQYFIYDKARHEVMIQDVAQYLEVDAGTLAAAFEKQLAATLGALGSSKGKDILEVRIVDAENKVVKITPIGKAPDGSKN